MVRLTDASAIVFDWLNGDVRTLRRDYERVRAKPVPPDAAWLKVGAVRVLRFAARVGGTSTPHPASTSFGGPLPEWRAGTLASRLSPSSPQRGEGGANAPDEGGAATLVPLQGTTAIVYFHGGGFIVGSPVTHADVAVRLARHTGLPLYSVDYRLAPDHPAPAPAEDGTAVIRHLIDNGIEKIILCGDSAGGAIALATEAQLDDDVRRHVAAVASFYGAHGLLDTASIRERGSRADGADRATVNRYFELAGRTAYSVETLARPSSVPVYLMAAEEDPVRDDTLVLADALHAKGRAVSLDRAPGADHGFLHGGGENHLAEQAAARFASWLANILK